MVLPKVSDGIQAGAPALHIFALTITPINELCGRTFMHDNRDHLGITGVTRRRILTGAVVLGGAAMLPLPQGAYAADGTLFDTAPAAAAVSVCFPTTTSSSPCGPSTTTPTASGSPAGPGNGAGHQPRRAARGPPHLPEADRARLRLLDRRA
ncbi:hypothetical protein SALBM311S_01384 [Streptomyces alboniger]